MDESRSTGVRMVLAIAAALLAVGCRSNEPFPEAEGIRQLRQEFPAMNQMSDEEIADGGRALCAALEREGWTPAEFVEKGIGPASDEDSRKSWGLVFFAVRVYCPEYEDELPTEKPY